MTAIDTAKLRSLALAATTPGPWRSNGVWVFDAEGEAVCFTDAPSLHSTDQCEANAAWIAAASPSLVLALLDECERMRNLTIVSQGNESAARNERDNMRRELAGVTLGLNRTIEMQGDRIDEARKSLAAMTAARDRACDLAALLSVSSDAADEVIAALRAVGGGE